MGPSFLTGAHAGKTFSCLLLITALGFAGLLTAPACAESTFVPAANTGSAATAWLDFSIVIPQVLFLRVGTSSGNAATDGAIDPLALRFPLPTWATPP